MVNTPATFLLAFVIHKNHGFISQVAGHMMIFRIIYGHIKWSWGKDSK